MLAAIAMIHSVLILMFHSVFKSINDLVALPITIAVIGGLISSTALSLALVPAVYEVVDDFEAWPRPTLARFVQSNDERSMGTAQQPDIPA